MELSNFLIQDTDCNGNHIKIICEGTDDQKLAHFGGLDLYLKAARSLIAGTASPMTFPEKNGDYNIREKVVGLLLNEVGELLRNTSFDSEHLEEYSNIELVKFYLEELSSNKIVRVVVEEDEVNIRKFKSEVEEEERKNWSIAMSGLKKETN